MIIENRMNVNDNKDGIHQTESVINVNYLIYRMNRLKGCTTKFISYVPPTVVVKLLQHSGLGSNTGMGFHPMNDLHQCLKMVRLFFGFVDLVQNSGGCLFTG